MIHAEMMGRLNAEIAYFAAIPPVGSRVLVVLGDPTDKGGERFVDRALVGRRGSVLGLPRWLGPPPVEVMLDGDSAPLHFHPFALRVLGVIEVLSDLA